jgi:hypothetical protein
VGTWEIVYYKFMPGFAKKYAAHLVERAKASGANQQKLDETEQKAKGFKQMYDNPAVNVALTFMKVFPSAWWSHCARPGFSGRRLRKCPSDDPPSFFCRLRDTFARLSTLHRRMLVLEVSTLLELRRFSTALTSR